MDNCTSCGEQLTGQKFCTNCGAKNPNVIDPQLEYQAEQPQGAPQQNTTQQQGFEHQQDVGQQQNYGQQQANDQNQNYGYNPGYDQNQAYGNQSGYNQQSNYENNQYYGNQQNYTQQGNPEWRKFAIAALVCGVIALTIPIPVLDLIAGIVAIVLIVRAGKLGGSGALFITALVFTILGTLMALVYTVSMLFLGALFGGMFNMFSMF